MFQRDSAATEAVVSQAAPDGNSPSKMDPALKAKWIKALRSGKYKQGSGGLRRNDKYCCLGVLCEVGALGEWKLSEYEQDDGSIKTSDEFECHFKIGRVDEALLPHEVRDEIGLSTGHHRVVWKMNDDLRKTFPEIADYIEEHL